MNKIGGPVRENLDKYKKLAEDVFGTKPISVDFSNTEVAYAHKDDQRKRTGFDSDHVGKMQ